MISHKKNKHTVVVLRPPASKAVTKSLKGNRSDEIPSNLSLVLTEKLEI